MKKTLLLLSIILLANTAKSQSTLTLNQINSIWSGGQVPRGLNNTNTWYTLFNRSNTKWDVAGNTTGSDTSWLGTIDNRDFLLKTNNTTRMYFLKGGNVGVGVSPSAKFQVLSTAEQVRVNYDASKYLSITVGSSGSTTLNNSDTSSAIVTNTVVSIDRTGKTHPSVNYLQSIYKSEGTAFNTGERGHLYLGSNCATTSSTGKGTILQLGNDHATGDSWINMLGKANARWVSLNTGGYFNRDLNISLNTNSGFGITNSSDAIKFLVDANYNAIVYSGDYIVDNTGKGFILKSSSDNHYYRYTAGVAGALVITDLGTSY